MNSYWKNREQKKEINDGLSFMNQPHERRKYIICHLKEIFKCSLSHSLTPEIVRHTCSTARICKFFSHC